MGEGAVDLCLRRAPFVVQQVGIARTILGFGTHTLLRAAGGVMSFVLQELVGIDTLELAFGELLVALEAVAEGAGKRVPLHFPELCGLDACGVELQGCSHRGEELRLRLASHEDEQCLVL